MRKGQQAATTALTQPRMHEFRVTGVKTRRKAGNRDDYNDLERESQRRECVIKSDERVNATYSYVLAISTPHFIRHLVIGCGSLLNHFVDNKLFRIINKRLASFDGGHSDFEGCKASSLRRGFGDGCAG